MDPGILKSLKKDIVKAATVAGEGHIASAFSILDILWVLYDRVLKIDPQNPRAENRDRFILSKGHAALALYVVLAEKGFFPKAWLEKFAAFDSPLGGHPDRNSISGVETSTGSLGHGFPISVGIALALKLKKNIARVFVIIGDSECNEGTIWESVLLANHHQLDNLCCIVDYNHSTDRALSVGDLSAKFKSFGWQARSINGHDHQQIFEAVSAHQSLSPLAVVAETVKGYGCRIMENNPAWHHKVPNDEELKSILGDLA